MSYAQKNVLLQTNETPCTYYGFADYKDVVINVADYISRCSLCTDACQLYNIILDTY